MRTVLIVLGALALVVAIGILNFIPLSSPKEVCRPVAQWDGREAGWRLDHPMGLAWDGRFLYVADTENRAVKKLQEDGSLVAIWTGFQRPVAVAAADDVVYLADFLADRISKLWPDGTLVLQWGQHGGGTGEFDAPSGIAVDREGFVYVADFYNHRIEKFTGDGAFVTQWGSNGRWSGQFHYPTDVAVSATGDVFVADGYNQRVQKFTDEGVYLAKWGGLGYGIVGKWPGWFRLAKALAVGPGGNVYVADAFNHRIQEFTADGKLLGIWGDHPSPDGLSLQYPAGIAAGADGRVYVSDFFKNRIWELDCR
jgi:tripartite motif-containing protein 71